LKEVNKYFDVGIFTASVKEYADAVISFLDPENKLIKYKLYRNNCINFNDSFMIKDLRIFKNVDLSKIILLDNSMYSFATQINNGILINSFFNDKNDTELNNALEYLISYIVPAEDVREVNEEFFNFGQILSDLQKCK
jgi:CTD small phosphatase-like protein 2